MSKTRPQDHVQIFNNNHDTYEQMLAAINGAEKQILFANFCFRNSKIFDRFAEALTKKAASGVEVKILADDYGSQINNRQIETLRDAGAQWVWFNPWRPGRFWQYNHRLHKKLLIIDGVVGFTGGVGVANFWTGSPAYPSPWRDSHFRISGPAAAIVIEGFNSSWQKFSDQKISIITDHHDSSIEPVDSLSQSLDMTAAGEKFQQVIDSAERHINITTAYFGPNRIIRGCLARAAEKGVAIRILVNGPHSTHRIALQAGRYHYQGLLDKGIKIYEYQPTKLHAKLLTADSGAVIIGSANLNFRSLYHDDEHILVINDEELANKIDEDFERDIINSDAVVPSRWRARPMPQKFKPAVFSLGRYFF